MGRKNSSWRRSYEKEGVPLMVEVVESLKATGQEVGLPFDLTPLGRID